MQNNDLRKPLFSVEIDKIQEFTDHMTELGFKVDFISKPETIKNLSIPEFAVSYCDAAKIVRLTDKSIDKLQEYLMNMEADGGIVLSVFSRYDNDKFGYCELTIVPYKLDK